MNVWEEPHAEYHENDLNFHVLHVICGRRRKHKAPESKYFFQRRLYSEQFQFFAAAIKNHVKECMRDLMP
jgi:hypothetical protein